MLCFCVAVVLIHYYYYYRVATYPQHADGGLCTLKPSELCFQPVSSAFLDFLRAPCHPLSNHLLASAVILKHASKLNLTGK